MKSTKLQRLLPAVYQEVARAKQKTSETELRARLKDAQPVRSMEDALRQRFGLIAEIKEKSPSGGMMRAENVKEAAEAYEDSPIVQAVSILTNKTHFGMSIERLAGIRSQVSKPILRKDFIVDPYQILEARAYGADAVLLMGNVITDPKQLQEFSEFAFELGLEVLFESHTQVQIDRIPSNARIYGINSRLMDSGTRNFFGLSRYSLSRILINRGWASDISTNFEKFRRLLPSLPTEAIKVAESGISSSTIAEVREMGFDAALVGNSLLLAQEGVASALSSFEAALDRFEANQTPPLPLAKAAAR